MKYFTYGLLGNSDPSSGADLWSDLGMEVEAEAGYFDGGGWQLIGCQVRGKYMGEWKSFGYTEL